MGDETGPVTTVRAATLVAPKHIEIRDYPFPTELEPGAILLRMIASGICGTDKHTFRGETMQYAGTAMERTTPFPIIQGHENIGEVEAVGPGDVRAYDGNPLQVGDRVVPAPNVACGRCARCQRGFPYYLCRNLQNYGNSMTSAEAPHLFGGWSDFLYLKPGTAVFRVPPELPSTIGVLTEIFAVEVSEVRELTGDLGVDLVVNATGFPGSFASALGMVRDAGTVLEVGAFVDMGPEAFNPAVICGRSLTLMGTGGEDLAAYPGTLALLDRHQHSIPFAEMVSHTFPVREAARALETSLDAENATKVLISNALI